jgi:NAD(P)-dependent dehydrogenase (short-subunit alcohol dehydrogenase family)
MSRPLEPIPVDLQGRSAVVTGATSGIGKEAAYALARLGATVVVVGRTEDKARTAADELEARGVPRARLETAGADFSSVAAVTRLADELAARYPELDVLLNNAGCYPSARVMTPEGLEESWATNVLSYEVMTTRLLGPVKAARGRIVYVASTRAGDLDASDLEWSRRRFSGVGAYSQSKQANRMLAWAWSRRLAGSGVTIQVAHPGGVATNIAGRQTGLYGWLARLVFKTQRTPTMGADVLVWLAASPELEGRAVGLFKDRREIPCRFAADVAASEALWTLCQEQIGQALGAQ